jgi:hypothetical protein
MRRIRPMLWVIAILFVASCFISGAWLGNKLSSIPPITTKKRASTEEVDRVALRRKERETAIATAIATPGAILILFLTGLLVATRGGAKAPQRMNSSPGRPEIGLRAESRRERP